MRRAFLFLAMTVIAASAGSIAQAQTRYGSADSGTDQPQPMLSWPGKPAATPSADDRYALQQPLAPTSFYHQPAQQPSAPTSLYDQPPPRWRSADSAPVAPLPQAPPANPQAPNGALGPHFYSVARQYGVQPDPVQLSPQFLASTPQADLAEPPPLPPPHTAGPQSANMSTAAATNQVRQAQEAAADADTVALGN